MAILSFLTKSYAQNVYIYGNRNFTGVPVEYHQSVKEYAGATYSEVQIKAAFEKGYITEAEYVETMQVKNPGWEMPKQPEPVITVEAPYESMSDPQPEQPLQETITE